MVLVSRWWPREWQKHTFPEASPCPASARLPPSISAAVRSVVNKAIWEHRMLEAIMALTESRTPSVLARRNGHESPPQQEAQTKDAAGMMTVKMPTSTKTPAKVCLSGNSFVVPGVVREWPQFPLTKWGFLDGGLWKQVGFRLYLRGGSHAQK